MIRERAPEQEDERQERNVRMRARRQTARLAMQACGPLATGARTPGAQHAINFFVVSLNKLTRMRARILDGGNSALVIGF